jgi:pilus assembly protein FimV
MSINFESINIENKASMDAVSPTKSKAALETLLSLANTYISMGDEEAAVQSLEEVIQYGSKKQQEAAQLLLQKLSKKSN